MKDLDSGGAKSAKLREISLLYSRLLVKCRIWTLEVPKVQKLWEPNCVWNEESGVWGCQKWEKQFGNLIYSTFPTLPSTNRRDFWARFQILHSTRSREYRSEISRSFCIFCTSRVQILHSTRSREYRGEISRSFCTLAPPESRSFISQAVGNLEVQFPTVFALLAPPESRSFSWEYRSSISNRFLLCWHLQVRSFISQE